MIFLLKLRRIYILFFLLTILIVIYILYIKKERRDFIKNDYRDNADDEMGRKLIKQRTHMRTLNKIRTKIIWYNTKQDIHNLHLGPVSNKTYVIVIQCHCNVHHLKRLLNSLKKAYFINSAFLIFSHDYYSDKMNKVIKHIDFAKYIQIFYPYSMQLHPNVFPGEESESCIEGLPCVNSMKIKLRNPEAAQSKHHWWWQANQIFDHLSVLKDYKDPILFIEAQNYVVIDVLFVFRLLVHARNIHCPFCEIINLAAHNPELSRYKKRKSKVTVEAWTSTMSSTAIAFDSNIWRAIKIQKDFFCYFNDTNWDNTLKHLAATKWGGNIYFIAIEGPRVLDLEECDDKDVRCKQKKVKDVKEFIKLIYHSMFPLSINIDVTVNEGFSLTTSGYWSDVRDHELCMYFANDNV